MAYKTSTWSLLGLYATTTAVSQTIPNQALEWDSCEEVNALVTRNGTLGEPVECAHLNVPLDYTLAESEPLELDLFRVRATEEPILGSVLINFGGPGAEGATNLPVLAAEARKSIGAQWNLVSWDPRGTGYTIPFACGLTETGTGVEQPVKRDEAPLVSTNLTEIFLNGGWEAAGQAAADCAGQVSGNASLIGTAFTARDMIEIVDALGEDGLLRYYGWSYGTALGSYVAAMFPERVERMVLDGNMNPHDYQAGHYGSFAQDGDSAFAGFIDTCFAVEDDCALYTLLQPNSTDAMYDAINAVIAPLSQNATTSIDGYNTYVETKAALYGDLFFPVRWPELAKLITAALGGRAPEPPSPPEKYGEAVNAITGIRGSDAIFIANSSDEYLSQVQFQSTVSPAFSDVMYFTPWIIAQWPIPAKERYWGDFRVQTKSPILYVNGQFDPSTPLANARNGSETFNGSVVLEHSGYGHGIFVHPSDCVSQYVLAYFLDGSLPPSDEVCEPDVPIADFWRQTVSDAGGEDGTGSDDSGSESGEAGAAVRLGNTASIALSVLTIAVVLLM